MMRTVVGWAKEILVKAVAKEDFREEMGFHPGLTE